MNFSQYNITIEVFFSFVFELKTKVLNGIMENRFKLKQFIDLMVNSAFVVIAFVGNFIVIWKHTLCVTGIWLSWLVKFMADFSWAFLVFWKNFKFKFHGRFEYNSWVLFTGSCGELKSILSFPRELSNNDLKLFSRISFRLISWTSLENYINLNLIF